jgi:hypothetical protein
VIVTTAQYTVGTTAAQITASDGVNRQITIHAIGNSAVYLGASSAVTTSTGFYIDKNAGPLQIEIDGNDELWAISSASSQVVTVLQITL